MNVKKSFSGVLAATVALSAVPASQVATAEDYSSDDIGTVDNNTLEAIPESIENIGITLESHTENSLSISWGGISYNIVSYYEIICNNAVIAQVTEQNYLLSDLESGKEYSIEVKAYDSEGSLVGESVVEIFYTDWIISEDYTLTADTTVGWAGRRCPE